MLIRNAAKFTTEISHECARNHARTGFPCSEWFRLSFFHSKSTTDLPHVLQDLKVR